VNCWRCRSKASTSMSPIKRSTGKTLAELASLPASRGVFLRKIVRGATATNIPIMADTQLQRGGYRHHRRTTPGRSGRHQDVGSSGSGDRLWRTWPSSVRQSRSEPCLVPWSTRLVVCRLRFPLPAVVLIAGLFFGWLRSVRPTFGRIPSSTVWFMNSVGLNVFIAVVGLSSGPGFVAGLQQLGFSLFLWGVAVTSVPLILAMYVGKYVFRFDDAIVLGCCSGARTTTASLGMINDRARSQIPA